jgi:hypothetical protein
MDSKIINSKILDSGYHKYDGIAPDGFILVPLEIIEKIKVFENWKEFIHNPNWIEDKSKEFLKR